MTERTNTLNDGRAFQDRVAKTTDVYRSMNVLRMHKVDPPVRVVGSGAFRKVLFMENQFLDFVGSWTERGGRMLAIEVKSTKEPRLGLGANLTIKQKAALLRWHNSGAAVGVLWEWKDRGVVFLPLGQIETIFATGRRHVKFEEGDPVAQGNGFILVDYVKNLRRWYNP